MEKLSATQLKDMLTKVTIGGANDSIDLVEKAQVFAEYIQRAFPEYQVLNIIPTNTSAALNSVSGIVKLRLPDGSVKELFGKIHIESNTESVSPLGSEKEYANTQMLARAGMPVLEPVAVSRNTDYPLLLYPVIKAPALFDLLEETYVTGVNKLSPEIIDRLARYNKKVGEKASESVRKGSTDEGINAPVQTLFLRRVESGGRIDQWYSAETIFSLPGLESPITWQDLSDAKWTINGVPFRFSLREIIAQARRNLAFQEEKESFLILSHGDDHAGNVFLTDEPLVFDPAFAGWNPIALDVKALAHTGFLPLSAMYYFPKGLSFVYEKKPDAISVVTNMQNLNVMRIQEVLARQIIDLRIIPILRMAKSKGADVEKEIQKMRSALSCCALLTVNIAKLLKQKDGRGIGLLPIAIMLSELKGLPVLDYLSEQVKQLKEE